MVPEGWDVVPLSDVCELINGRGFKPHEWSDTGYPIIRIQNLNGSLEFNHFDGEFNPKILVRDEELLFAWSGSRGTSFGPHIWRGPEAVLNYHTWKVLPKAGTDKPFLFHLLRHITSKIEASAHGASALVHTQKSSMEKRHLTVPPLPEQRKIAEILSTWDKAIETTEKLLANAEAQKKALMQQLLTGKRRLKGFEGAWQRAKLIELVELQRGFDLPSTQRVDGPYPVISSSGHSGQHCEAKVKGPGIVTGRYGSIGEFFFVEGDFWPLNTTLWVKNFHRNDPLFAYYFLQSIDLKKHSGKTGVPGINRNDIHAIAIQFPPPDEQLRIAEVLKIADSEIRSHTHFLLRLVKEKQALMQQLLTGKRRVGVR
ncbi:MAG: restriction endonuclease subunit S [Labrenzia sp.]